MKKLLMSCLLGLGFLGFTAIANANLIYNLGGHDVTVDGGANGATLPQNALVLTFEQAGYNLVKMTLDATNMPANLGKISDVWFNVDGFTFKQLYFDWVSGVKVSGTTGIAAGGNVGTMGTFDVNFHYDPSGRLGKFFSGEKSVYDISSATNIALTVDDFVALSSNGYDAAFHMAITGNGNSGHYTTPTADPVPEPGTMMLFGTGLLGLAGMARRMKQ